MFYCFAVLIHLSQLAATLLSISFMQKGDCKRECLSSFFSWSTDGKKPYPATRLTTCNTKNARWMVFPWISFQNLRCCTFGIWTLLRLCSRNRCIGEHLWLLEEISAKDSCNHWAKFIAISQSANLNPFEILCTGRSLLFKKIWTDDWNDPL